MNIKMKSSELPDLRLSETKISVQHLVKQFKSKKKIVSAIDDVNLTVNEGEFVTIVGPSGCGKTTTLRILAELETPTSGRVEIIHRDQSKPLNTMVFNNNPYYRG